MTTAIAMWGNSAAVRIPRKVLQLASLFQGDEVEVAVNERGNIEISAAKKEHRRVDPKPGVTFASLFSAYNGPRLGADAWPSDDMAGAEEEAWSE